MSRAELEASVTALVRVLETAPDFANGWFNLAEMHRQLGQSDAAITAYRKVIELDPSDIFGAGLRLARLRTTTPEGMPEAYVRGMFDQYAPRFDRELVETLGYRAPALLRAAVETACLAQGRAVAFDTMLDLGCGTGLGGAAFRDCVKHLTGVDLSTGMIALAQHKKIYDRLEAGEIERYLGEIAAARSYSLIVAADVFAYLASLRGVCAAAARVMARGALFAFTVETHRGDGVVLGEGLRYAHGAMHVRTALDGLELLELSEVSTRNESGTPVPGLLVVAQRNKQKPRAQNRITHDRS